MVIVVCHVKFRRCREIKPAMTLQGGTPCIAKLTYNLLNVWVYGDISTVNGVIFFINYVDGVFFHQLCWWRIGRRDDRSWSAGNQASWHLCCNSRFSGLTLEVPKRANTFGAILAIPMSLCFLGYLENPVFFLPSGTSWFCTDLCIWFSATTWNMNEISPVKRPLNHGDLAEIRSTFDQLKWLWIPDVRWGEKRADGCSGCKTKVDMEVS